MDVNWIGSLFETCGLLGSVFAHHSGTSAIGLTGEIAVEFYRRRWVDRSKVKAEVGLVVAQRPV